MNLIIQAKSSLPFGVHCFPDPIVNWLAPKEFPKSSLPFGVHCFPDWNMTDIQIQFMCLHCLSAFTAFPTGTRSSCRVSSSSRLHCLSAFTAFPTHGRRARMQCVSRRLHCLSAFTAFPTEYKITERAKRSRVFIAFRRSLLSRQADVGNVLAKAAKSLHCLSAFTAFPTST